MSRTHEQNIRISFERSLSAKYMPNVKFQDYGEHIWVEGRFTPSKSNTRFCARLLLSSDYPYRQPDLYVVEPKELRMYQSSTTLRDLGSSHDYHLYRDDSAEGVKVCFTDYWDASLNCVKVFMKLALWLEAYVGHLQTGKTIAVLIEELEKGNLSTSFLLRSLQAAGGQAGYRRI